jgi:hypothetical protein
MNTAATYMTATATSFYLGVCQPCVRPTRQQVQDGGQFEWLTCPQCDGEVRGERIHATLTYGLCHPECMGAVGPSCSCSCGGKNHGGAFGEAGEMLETAVQAYRDRMAALEAKREAKAAKVRQVRQDTFDEWAADHADVLAYLDSDVSWSSFFTDLAYQVADLKPLSERQVASVRKAVASKAARDAERAARAARLNAIPLTAAPLGRQTGIEGEIVDYRQFKNQFGPGLDEKITVECGGYRVKMSLPRSLRPTVFNALEYQEFTKALRGTRIRFTATLEPGRDGDPSVVKGLRPSQVTVL